MRLVRDEAWLLRTHALGEADLILTLLAEEHGGVRAVARSARRSRRRFGGALEPLTRLRVSWSEKEGRELHRIETIETVRSYAPMQSEPAMQAACAVLAEVAEVYSRDGHPDARAFRLLGACLDALEAGGEPWPVIRYFEWWTLRLHGLLPDLAACARCGAALDGGRGGWAGEGQLRCRGCLADAGGSVRRFGDEARRFLEQVRSTPPGELVADRDAVGPGGPLEAVLRGTLEAFAERRFRTYRHLAAWTKGEA